MRTTDDPTRRTRQRLSRRLAFSVGRLAVECDVGRSLIYQEIRESRLVARKIRRRTIIRRADAIRWLRSLPVVSACAGQSDSPAGGGNGLGSGSSSLM